MPGATGPVIVERMRRRAPEVKVLLMSGYAEHPLLEAAHAAGEPCLVKPFEIASFSGNRRDAYSTPNAKSTLPGRPIRLTYPELT